MVETNKKSILISELIKELEEFKKSEGDVEVFTANKSEACFDGIGKIVAMKVIEDYKTYAVIINNEVLLKP